MRGNMFVSRAFRGAHVASTVQWAARCSSVRSLKQGALITLARQGGQGTVCVCKMPTSQVLRTWLGLQLRWPHGTCTHT